MMRTRFRFLVPLILSFWATAAHAQTILPVPVTGNLATANAEVTGAPGTAPSVLIQLSGTWTGTVTFRASGNGGFTYVDALGVSVTTGATSTTATSNGAWVFANGGYDAIRAVFTTATSGTVVVNIQRGYAQAKIASPVFGDMVADSLTMDRTNQDVVLFRNGASDVGVRGLAGTAGSANIFSNYTNSGNNEFVQIVKNAGSTADIYTGKAGSGTVRNLQLYTGGAATLNLGTNSTIRWYLDASNGHLIPNAHNTYDFGSAAAAVRTGYFATSLFTPYPVEANTGTKAVSAAESREWYTNTGDGDGSIINLVDDPTIGLSYGVAVTAAQTITINTGTGETIWLAGTSCGTDITGNDTGASLLIVAVTGGSGAIWHAIGSGTWTC